MTFSIAARDDATGELGVAVASHAFGVRRAVPFAVPGVGAVVTQGTPVPGHAERLLAALAGGRTAEAALAELVDADGGAPLRQTALVAASGAAVVHTGALCIRFAGHVVDGAVSCQGNLLAADGAWDRMLEAYRSADGALEDRLLAALDAGLAAGGDLRGQQSAALLVVGPDPDTRPRVDLGVDDDPAPLEELRRLLALDRADRMLRDAIAVVTGAPGDPRDAIRGLDEAQRVFGPGNREPDFWAAIIAEHLGDGGGRSAPDGVWREFRRRLMGPDGAAPGTAETEEAG